MRTGKPLIKGLILLIVLFLAGCGTENTGDVPAGFRVLNEEEYVIWELAVGCFIESGIPPFDEMEYREPFVEVVADVEPDCGAAVAACSILAANGVVVHENFYYTENGINKALFVHEYKHLILYRAGEDYSHESTWYQEGSPCPDNMLEEQGETNAGD